MAVHQPPISLAYQCLVPSERKPPSPFHIPVVRDMALTAGAQAAINIAESFSLRLLTDALFFDVNTPG